MKILIVDDHITVRLGLVQICQQMTTETLEAVSGEGALILLENDPPDVILLDINMPGMSGYEFIRRALGGNPGARIIVFSMHAEPAHALRALKEGAAGYVTKGAAAEEIRAAILLVSQGKKYVEPKVAQAIAIMTSENPGRLSDRDLEILRLLGEGLTFWQIAEALGLGYKTIANSATAIKAKLGVRRTSELVRLATDMRR